MSKRKGPATNIRHLLEYAIVRFLIFILRPLSAKCVFKLGRVLGALSYRAGGKRKKIARINLDIAFGDGKSNKEKQQIIKNSFTQMAVSTLQTFWVIKCPERVHQLIEGEPAGLDTLKQCLERGKGIFFLTAHYGNWEIMGIDHGYRGICKLNSIFRRLDNPYLDELVMQFRTVSGNGVFCRDESPLRIVRAIKRNETVAVMMDQNTAKGGIFVNFFGTKAATARALALLSHRTGAAVLPLFSYPTDQGTYRIEYGPELSLKKSEDKEHDVIAWTQACETFIEQKIRDAPEPWMWAHRRWKTRPPEEQGKKIY
ncbi:MAG TPA: lysophospholipid acyltransferase family protein [Nitrospinaceae bacterium]|nr:lysophospholipid acyltransferase family protein [Nitrospinaceae bacterium]